MKRNDAIPAFECLDGCTDCCGVIAWTTGQWAKVAAEGAARGAEVHAAADGYVMVLGPGGSTSCPFATAKGCAVYERRPTICRLFGAVDDPKMVCPHGCGPRRKLSSRKGVKIMGAERRKAERRPRQ